MNKVFLNWSANLTHSWCLRLLNALKNMLILAVTHVEDPDGAGWVQLLILIQKLYQSGFYFSVFAVKCSFGVVSSYLQIFKSWCFSQQLRMSLNSSNTYSWNLKFTNSIKITFPSLFLHEIRPNISNFRLVESAGVGCMTEPARGEAGEERVLSWAILDLLSLLEELAQGDLV